MGYKKQSMSLRLLFSIILIAFYIQSVSAQTIQTAKKLTPIIGWSSWNNYRVDISEQIIKAQADAMIASGMKNAGYEFINVDDGFFGGRDKDGNLIVNRQRFPKGMKDIADYIHAKGLKAGIYSDAGTNTCASMWDKDTIGTGCGLFNHEEKDLKLMLGNWGYDFIKVDWCGGEKLELDEEATYTRIGKLIHQINPKTIFNVCRWQFPGKWVCNVADSWRVSGDIRNTFESIVRIIDLNADLWRYAGPGHVNDMDMLQVGRGMSYEEDKAHFSMWCMLASPLLAGNDLTNMSKQTISILTNKDMIAIDQDPLVYQARRLKDYGDKEIWARPLTSTMSGKIAVALLNRSDKQEEMTFNIDSVGINSKKGYTLKDAWTKKISSKQFPPTQSAIVPAHGVVVFIVQGSSDPFNVFQKL